MFEYPNQPSTRDEVRAAIWAALQEIAALCWREIWIEERAGVNNPECQRELMDIEHRQGVAIEALQYYSSQRWLSRAEYSEWWQATIGQASSDVCYYLFEQ
jgi:hypothetical protein